MIKRVFTSLTLLSCLCITTMANQEVEIRLNNRDKNKVSERLEAFGNIYFEYIETTGNNAKIMISVENLTIPESVYALLVFKRDMDDNFLKQGKPKIEFEKKYPGKKGERMVYGCNEIYRQIEIVPYAQKDTICTIEIPLASSRKFVFPWYVAKYKHKDLLKKDETDIKYKIYEQFIDDFHIEVEGWSEEDTTYISTKNDVDEFIKSLKDIKFCSNKKHPTPLKVQQRPYQEKKDSLISRINTILNHNEWMSDQAPHKAYTKLLTELNNINLNSFNYDCGSHRIKPKGHDGGHNCGYCSLSAQDIYYRLDNLYQQLHTGKIKKDQALKTAKALYNCYQQSKKRQKDSSYGAKIVRFYNSTVNY